MPEFFTKWKTREKEKAGGLFFEVIRAARGSFLFWEVSNKSGIFFSYSGREICKARKIYVRICGKEAAATESKENVRVFYEVENSRKRKCRRHFR